jgi:hypothetical protein
MLEKLFRLLYLGIYLASLAMTFILNYIKIHKIETLINFAACF